MGKTERQGEMYRIYLVEDDTIIARSIKKHLENWEYEVQCTKDFSAVTKEFAEFAPQLVLMDIGLPFTMDITGAVKSAKFPRCRLSFSLQLRTI